MSYLKKLATLRALVVALLALFAAGAAYALTVDQTRIINKRFDPDGYHPSTYRVTINFNDPNIGTAQAFGALGKNEFIKAIDCHVTTAFNAGTSNAVVFGTSTAATEVVAGSGAATAAIAANSTGVQHLTTAGGLGLGATSAADVTLYGKYVQAGTAATAGSVTCVIEFVPNNDM
jgi:hypothetical protein